MPTLVGLDLGTTTVTALAVDAERGTVLAKETRPNDAERTSTADKAKGYSEWDADRITAIAFACLQSLGEQVAELPVGLGITGQQHGCLLVDANGQAISPLVNWQDQRGRELFRDTTHDITAEVRSRLPDTIERCGCRISHGYLATTVFWWQEQGRLANHSACFLPDYVAAQLTQQPPTTDPTLAASSGIFNLITNTWDEHSLRTLGLHENHLPFVKPCGTRLGMIRAQQLPSLRGVPVFVPMGDNQASVLGSLAEPLESVLVNIGTGGQVSAIVPTFQYVPRLETRPYPTGFLLTSAGLAGGRAYAALERFVRQIGTQFFHADENISVYEQLNQWAATIATGADGVCCEPFFGGTRVEPTRRATWTGLTFDNFTIGHLARSLLEGTANALAEGYETMSPRLQQPRTRLIGAGNGIRENCLLANIIEQRFGLPMRVPAHREEAAYGAALLAGIGQGLFAWNHLSQRISYA